MTTRQHRKISTDTLAALTVWLFETVGVTHPIRFSLSIAGAMFIKTAAALVYASFPLQLWARTLSELPYQQLIGVVFVPLFAPLLLPRRGLPEQARIELELVEELSNKAGLSDREKHLVYLGILDVAI